MSNLVKVLSCLAILMLGGRSAMAAGYAAVWQPGNGEQRWRAGMTVDEFKVEDKKWFDKGLRIRSLVIKGGRFTAVWQPGSGEQRWRSGMNVDQFKAEDKSWFDKGLRLVALEIDNGAYAGVWRPGSGEQRWRSGMNVDQFKADDTSWFNKGLRLVALERHGGSYAAVWRPGNGEQRWRSGMTGSEAEQEDRKWFDKGLRMRLLEVENGRYTAVWRPGSGTQWWSGGFCFLDFKTADAAYFSQGLRLGFLETQDEAGSPWRYPWKSGVQFSVAQGNNNASGSHNGSQSFAFDFSLPSNTTIRAARAGTVEWLQESQTTTYNPNAPTTASNTPFPAGSLQNWGNAVRIRHAGGLTSWYFHIKTNGVLVNVGDTVERGQPIAISDNTGRSGGPHLHFQVQADSVNWGQSVAISFQNCQVPTGGNNVTSSNANSNFP